MQNTGMGCGAMKRNDWLISEDTFSPDRAKYFETIFTLANGYLGVRGSAEEGNPQELPGSYLAGVFNKAGDEPPELPNIPTWIGVSVTADGREISHQKGTLVGYHRYLDMRRGVLVREFRIKKQGRITRVRTERFVSKSDAHIAAIRYSVTPENYSARFVIESSLQGEVSNGGRSHLSVIRAEAFSDDRAGSSGSVGDLSLQEGMLLETKTLQSGIQIAQAVVNRLAPSGSGGEAWVKTKTGAQSIAQSLAFDAKRGQEYVFDKVVVTFTSRDGFADPAEVAMHCARRAGMAGYESLVASHEREWERVWKRSDIRIEGDEAAESALRFSMFHSIACAPTGSDKTSLGAKGLHGEGYRGHVFWDCEIFNLPMFIHTQPDVARNLLMYRYHTLSGARRKAQAAGYRGAMYAWESADTGDETTPVWANHLGEKIRIWCGDIEQHISADVAYAVWQYCQATGDDRFLVDYGAEIIFETAGFWASRFEYNTELDRYEIRGVIGPDEYHEHIDNSVFTNAMARWNIRLALALADDLKARKLDEWAELKSRLHLNDRRLREWSRVSQKVYIPFSAELGIHEQFEGFLSLEKVDLEKLDLAGRPADAVLGREATARSQVIKQADVVMLMYLLGDEFDGKLLRTNYDYYAPICGHGSSLSPSVHAIMASRLGRSNEALHHFRRSASIDLDDGMGNSAAGIHLASHGGNWQAVVRGFCGVTTDQYAIAFQPALPAGWQSVSFQVTYRDTPISATVRPGEVTLDLTESGRQGTVPVKIGGFPRLLECGKVHIIQVPSGGYDGEPVLSPGLEPVLA